MESNTFAGVPQPNLFVAHPNFSDAINRNIITAEIEGGVHLREVLPGSVLAVETRNRVYKVVVLSQDSALISGHPEFCPEPVEVRINGSTWGGAMLWEKYIGRGMHLEFDHPVHRVVITSRILDIRAEPETARSARRRSVTEDAA